MRLGISTNCKARWRFIHVCFNNVADCSIVNPSPYCQTFDDKNTLMSERVYRSSLLLTQFPVLHSPTGCTSDPISSGKTGNNVPFVTSFQTFPDAFVRTVDSTALFTTGNGGAVPLESTRDCTESQIRD